MAQFPMIFAQYVCSLRFKFGSYSKTNYALGPTLAKLFLRIISPKARKTKKKKSSNEKYLQPVYISTTQCSLNLKGTYVFKIIIV